ncbi:GNAT family N-acetyltransferase [Streptomyces shenzhenensis]|uniref:GNAT family N-acetyltransferase n=1 Tax=Streptomyces shenzhenensis TaxID=943815 RepID=UPI001F2B121A|nr:GNAT family N-acetyltransferase [Streptomyces shenzhenensis]
MTTTLRPTEPLQHGADGALSRRFQVCVNSRPVGTLHLGTSQAFGRLGARIIDLRIEEPDRRRGRATVAALAAEEVARGWGCRQIEVEVPAAVEPALHLVEALGYVLRNRGMQKPLGDTPPVLPKGSRARDLTEAEYEGWLAHASEEYARTWNERGVPEAEAREKSRRDHARLLPQGLATEGVRLSVLEHEGKRVGILWLGVRADGVWVYRVETDAAHRGQGHGRTLMLLAEAQTIAAGEHVLCLNVFAGNTPAERLYESLGYVVRSYSFYKDLI